jgi:hypothetical protein
VKPPKTLQPRGPGRAFWRDIHEKFELTDPHHLKLLEQACGCLDEISKAQKEIESAGSFYKDRFGQPRSHPGYDLIKSNRTIFARLLRELQLDSVTPEDNRPPSLY